jgi:malonyl CoA-acyl carrier protein transacylase
MNSAADFSHTALVFPGQGSQRAEMRDLVETHCPELIELAVSEIGSDPFERVSEGTSFQQPALYCAAIAGWRAAGSPRAEWFAGHSLGELAAAAAAGAISTEDGLRLAITRGRVMQRAAEADPGGMLAVLGETRGVTALANSLGLTVANDNAPDQIVLSGPVEEIKEARARFKQAGVRTVRLPVAGAFHSPAMTAAVPEFRAALEKVEVEHHPELISSVAAGPFSDLREGLLAALTRPVRWRETVLRLRDLGASRFLESGPGEVLTGLVRRTIDGIDAAPLSSLANAQETADV